MKIKILLLAAILMALPAPLIAEQYFQNNQEIGHFSEINCAEGVTCSKQGGRLKIESAAGDFDNVDINGGTIDGVTIGASSAGDATFNILDTLEFTVGTTTGMVTTASNSVMTITETSSGSNRYLSWDLVSSSRYTLRGMRSTLLWRGDGINTTLLTAYSNNSGASFDVSSDSATSAVNFSLFAEGTNDWDIEAGGSSHSRANYLALISYYTGSAVEYLTVNKATGNFDFKSGLITTTSTVVSTSGTVGSTQAFLGKSTNVGCLMMRDTDDAGWSECTILNGTLSCGTDADGVCDGTA